MFLILFESNHQSYLYRTANLRQLYIYNGIPCTVVGDGFRFALQDEVKYDVEIKDGINRLYEVIHGKQYFFYPVIMIDINGESLAYADSPIHW